MSSTTTTPTTLQEKLDNADPNDGWDMLRKVKLGTLLSPLKRTFTGLTAAASFDLTAIDGTGETVGLANPKRLPMLAPKTLRVTAGAAAAGVRTLGDVGATPSATVATISDDGKTVTFEGNVTAFIIEYVPRSATDPSVSVENA